MDIPQNNIDIHGFVQMKDKDFKKLSGYIYDNYGIKVPLTKKVLLESRLQKRLRALSIDNFKEYLEKVIHNTEVDETINMIDEVSTNTTHFFRERDHFEFLNGEVLPKWRDKKRIKIWSAATSSGEEAYTIAIVIEELARNNNYVIPYEIFGTDISTNMLKHGVKGIYDIDGVAELPKDLLRNYFLRSKDKKRVRVIKEIRNKIVFARHNLMDNTYPNNKKFDIIFCRNALIYFDRKTQRDVIAKLFERLEIGGYLFLGHTESIFGLDLPLVQVAHTTYQKGY